MARYKTWRGWASALLDAFLHGAVAAPALISISPETFNFKAGLNDLIRGCVVFGILGSITFVRENRIPNPEGTGDTDIITKGKS